MTVDEELVFLNGRELAALIRTRKVSPVEVTTAFLDRVERLNPRVNAFILSGRFSVIVCTAPSRVVSTSAMRPTIAD